MRALLAGVLAIALGACSAVYDTGRHTGGRLDGSTPPGEDGAPPGADAAPRVPLDAFCDEYVRIVCDAVARCCPRAPAEWDQSTCRTNTRSVCNQMTQRVRDYAFLEWDEVAAHRTLAQGQAFVDDSCSTEVQGWYLDLDGYFGAIRGNRAAGAVCTPASTTDTYEVLAAVLSCQDDLRCIRGSRGDWNCLAPSTNGQACSLAFDCADPNARCERRILDGVCAVPGEELNSLCILPDECASLVCQGGRCVERTRNTVYCPDNVGLP
ncbi:MAG: hypothetical protein KF729_38405 [Sandaracinaceae bacterium]|nr:hypothetical protein [Sandaracinaceae bacterium]